MAAFGDPSNSTHIDEVLKQVAVAPDGICLDAEGAVWATNHQISTVVLEPISVNLPD